MRLNGSESKLRSIQFEESFRVIGFYNGILRRHLVSSFVLILSGFISRVLNLAIFILVVKVFLTVIDPGSSMEIISRLLLPNTEYNASPDSILALMLVGLSVLVLLQYVLSKSNLVYFLRKRRQILMELLEKPINDHIPTHFHVCLDHIPHGYDGIIKCYEIALFYGFLMLGIFILNPLFGLIVLAVIPVLLAILIYKGRKEIYVVGEMRAERQNIKVLTDDTKRVVDLINQQYSYLRNSLINAEVLGGVSIIVVMLIYLTLFEDAEFGGLSALVMVFAIRFSVLYAGEFSRNISRLLQQRVIVSKIVNVSRF